MHRLESSYGRASFDAWCADRPDDLRPKRRDTAAADRDLWRVASFHDLVERVAFLTSMNKRLTLLYRGQRLDVPPSPMLFREHWNCFGSKEQLPIGTQRRAFYWRELQSIGRRVYEICQTHEFGLPRFRGLRDTREVQWAVVQHYELWPTPLIDVTGSLRAAASFAMGCTAGTPQAPRVGYVYVVGMPAATGSISYDLDEQLVLARLQSSCPPVARRPHYQDGYLVGRFPLYDLEAEHAKKSLLTRRLVAKFELRDDGSFWTDDPVMDGSALLPLDDPLLERFEEEFGADAPGSLCARASSAT